MNFIQRTAPVVMVVVLSLTITATLALVGQAIYNWGLADLFKITMSYKQALCLMMILRYCRL